MINLKQTLKKEFERKGIDGILISNSNYHSVTFYIFEEYEDVVKNIAYNNLPIGISYNIEILQNADVKGLVIAETLFQPSKSFKEKGINILPRNKICKYIIQKFLSK